MILLLIIIALCSFSIVCGLVSISNQLDKIIDNQDIIKCIKKNK